MRIKLDRTICDGFGRCALQAPEYFSLDEWGYASLAGPGEVEEGERPGPPGHHRVPRPRHRDTDPSAHQPSD